jgi:CheY-like chemotaxis protein
LITLYLGPVHRAEFQAAVQAIRECTTAHFCNSLETCLAWTNVNTQRRFVPDLLCLAEEFPAQWSRNSLEQIAAAWPLAHWVGIYGSWCGGETRSGQPWPRLLRVSALEFAAWFKSQMHAWHAGLLPLWALPATSSAEERILFAAQAARHTRTTVPVCLYSSNTRQIATYVELLAALDVAATAHATLDAVCAAATAPELLLLNCCDELAAKEPELSALRMRFPHTPWLILLDFPRPQDYRLAARHGCHTILSKPCSLFDLAWNLQQLTLRKDAPTGTPCP